MALVQWRDSYSTHVKEVDEQHKHLIEMINGLHDAMKNGTSSEICFKTLKELVEYTDYHFKTEEKIFEQINYPDKVKHKNEHDILRRKAMDHLNNYKEKPLSSSIDVMHFLSDWLNHHILENDVKFGEYIKNNYKRL